SDITRRSTIGPAAEGGRGHDSVTALQYERRLSAKNQIEILVPFAVAHDQSGTAPRGVDVAHDQSSSAQRGVGDTGFGLKHVLFSNPQSGSIVSVLGVVTVPVG